MEYIGENQKQIDEKLGHQGANHFFRITSTQFKLCTKKTYDDIISSYRLEDCQWLMSYDEMLEIDRSFSRSFSRSFDLPDGAKYKSNVLQYKKDYTGLHPTQKPVLLLEDLIKTYSNHNDMVVDFTMGSGTTGVACKNTNRKFIGIEMDPTYYGIACGRILAS